MTGEQIALFIFGMVAMAVVLAVIAMVGTQVEKLKERRKNISDRLMKIEDDLWRARRSIESLESSGKP